MASANNDLYDANITHAADLRIHEEELQTQLARKLRRHEERLFKEFAKSGRSTNFMPELKRLNKELITFKKNSLSEIGLAELDFHSNSLQNAVGNVYKVKKPTSIPLLDKITGAGIKGNRNLEQQVNAVVEAQANRIDLFLKRNRDVSKSDLLKGVVQQTKMTRSQLDALLTTSMTQTQAEAFNKILNENEELVQGFRFTAVLDSKTSEICAHHDGKVYALDDTRYRPPLHWNCRSVMVPVIVPYSEMVDSKSSKFNKKFLSKLTDKEIGYFDGIIPAVETYSEWLRRQPESVILRHLSYDEDKLVLFQQGNLKLDSFTNARGKAMSIETLRKLDNRANISSPVRQKAFRSAGNENFKVEAYRVDDLIKDPTAKKQLQDLFIIDAQNSISPLSTTDFRGILAKTKRNNRFKANTFDEENFWFDPTTGESFNPLIYRPSSEILDSRLQKVKLSKILNNNQKRFIDEFQDSLSDKLSTNQRSAVVDNLRIIFERQLNPQSTAFSVPWENLTAVVRAENVNAVQNVSKLLETSVRRRSNLYSQFASKNKAAGVNILGEEITFDDISKNILSNQRFVDNWKDTQGLKLAANAYLKGRAPLRAYFLPPSQTNPLDFKKNLIKAIDNAVDKLNVPARVKKAYKELVDTWLKNPLDVAEDAIEAFAREIAVTWRDKVTLEFLYRNLNINLRKGLVDKLPSTQNKAIKTLSAAMEEIAKGRSTDYDAVAIAVGKRIRKEFAQDFPWWKPGLKDYHKDGSRLLKHLEDEGLIKVNFAMKSRRSATDLDTSKPDAGGWKEVLTREIEVKDKNLLKLQKAYRELYVGRRIGIVDKKHRLYIKEKTLNYEDSLGRKTNEKAITKSASSRFSEDEELLSRHIDRELVQQANFANKQKWKLDYEFTEFMEDVVYYVPRSDRKGPRTANAFKDLIHKRGEQGYGLIQALKWHRQNKTLWSNVHQWDGRTRFYEQGYLAATRGETIRPFLSSPVEKAMSASGLQELKIQLGATLGEGVEILSQQGRIETFDRASDDILELGSILQKRYSQQNRNIEDFLNNALIASHDAEEIPKVARYALEAKRIDDHARKYGFTIKNITNSEKGLKALSKYKSSLMVENDASSSGAQIIGLTTRDRQIAAISNVVPTTEKQRLYDIIARRTFDDSRYKKIKRLGDDIGWEDLAKAAKAQNMVTFYGAGEATQISNIEKKLAERILKKTDQLIIYKDKVPGNLSDNDRVWSWREIRDTLDKEISDAEIAGLTNVSNQLKYIKSEVNDILFNDAPVSSKLLHQARDVHTDAEDFIEKLTNNRAGLVGPKEFEQISSIMSEYLADLAPVTEEFINFWKDAARTYVPVANTVDIPWVTFDGKVLTQRYRPKVEASISFKDPVTGRMISNIYRDNIDDNFLYGKGSIGDAVTGLGVNGNHMNDASIVRRYWLQARKEDRRIATVHDGFFSHLEEADWTKDTLNRFYADATNSRSIQRTLEEMKKRALDEASSREAFRFRVKRVESLISTIDKRTFNREQINAAMATLPGLEDKLLASTNLDRRKLSAALGKYHNTALINDLTNSIDDGFYSIKSFKSALDNIPVLEKNLTAAFKLNKAGLLDRFAKHGHKRRLENWQRRIEQNNFSVGGFYNTFESQLRDKYDFASITGLEKAINNGSFNVNQFIASELKTTGNALDPAIIKNISASVLSENKGGVDPDLLLKGFINYRNSLKSQQRADIKAVNKWYQDTLENARRRKIIDKNITNKQVINKLDKVLEKVESKKFNSTSLPQLYRDFDDDLEKYFGIRTLAELNKAYSNGTFRIEFFLRDQNNRYRELTSQDILRDLEAGEDRYGIGP